jgi:hypothetical protein
MDKDAKSLSILKHEFGLQLYTAGALLGCFLLSIIYLKLSSPNQAESAKLFIIFYTAIIGIALPWQINMKGHLAPGYCRYHLSLPVHSWQLYLLPLTFRLSLILVFVMIEYGLYTLFYHNHSGSYYLSSHDMFYFSKMSILIYLALQAYGWSKDSVKNLYFYINIAFAICVLTKPEIITGTIDPPWFWLISVLLVVLAVVGVRNLRVGLIVELLDLQAIQKITHKRKTLEKPFTNTAQAQFHQIWKRSWCLMPMLTLLFIIMILIIDYKTSRYSSYYFEQDISVLTVLFFLISFSVPLIGMLTINSLSFKSLYVNNLPVSSKTLAVARLKCFWLSFAISLGIFFVFLTWKLFAADNTTVKVLYSRECILYNSLNARSMEFFQHPSVMIWALVALVIGACFIASVVVFIYSTKALSSKGDKKLTANGAAMLFCFLLYLAVCRYLEACSLWYRWSIPDYIYYSVVICALPVIDLILHYIKRKSFILQASVIMLILLASAGYNLLMNQFAVLALFPVVLYVAYPVAALMQQIKCKRHEIDNRPIELPWRLIKVAAGVFVLFALYTYIINFRQAKELRETVSQIGQINSVMTQNSPTFDYKKYLKSNMPDYSNAFLTDLDMYIKKERSKKYLSKLDLTVDYLEITIEKYCDNNEYEKAFKLLLFIDDTILKFDSKGECSSNQYMFKYILHKYRPPTKDLRKFIKTRKDILLRRYNILKFRLYQIAQLSSSEEVYSTLITPYYVTYKRTGQLNINAFTPVFLSPLCLNDQLNMVKTAQYIIKCLDYKLGEDGDILKYKANPSVLSNYLWINYNIEEKYQKSVILVAMATYRNKYGKFPDTLDELAPDFLDQRDLIISNAKNPYSYKLQSTVSLSPLLIRAKKSGIVKYMNEGIIQQNHTCKCLDGKHK